MGEDNVVETTGHPNTIDTLRRDLTAIGVRAGDVLLVHSSLARIGWVCGAEVAVVQALLEAVGQEGTLVMPAHSGANSDPAQWQHPPVPREWWDTIYATMPPFDKDCTPTHRMGRIAECFRCYHGTVRSDHPQTSFCANGPLADEIVGAHPLVPQFGVDSPLGKMYRLDAKVLLLGVGYDRCTSFHLAEVLTGRMPVVRMGAALRAARGERRWAWFDDVDPNGDDFERIGADYEAHADGVVIGRIGNAISRLFAMAPAVDFATRWMLEDRP